MFKKLFSLSILFSSLLQVDLLHADDFQDKIQPVFKSHCIKCHGGKKVKGKVNLKKVTSLEDLKADTEFLKTIIEMVDFEGMPPEDALQLKASERRQLLDHLGDTLKDALSANKVFAHTPAKRMNRFQYNNAVMDLFQLKTVLFALPERALRDYSNYFNPASGVMPDQVKVGCRPLGARQLIEGKFKSVGPFPQDLRAEHGYDNRGDHLSLSPLLLEYFLKLGSNILEDPNFSSKHVGIWDEFFAAPSTNPKGANELTLKARLVPFLRRAFRREVDPATLQRYSRYALTQIEAGANFTATMKEIASAVISSPKFLYLYDKASAEIGSVAVDDYDLASRLSFFLWGSLPDVQLLDLAKAGKLSRPEVLAAQVERMLNDAKLKRFADSFPTQWLQLERIISAKPNGKKHKAFKSNALAHMMLEPLLLFETVLIENRSIVELLDPSFTYQSDWLDHWSENHLAPELKTHSKTPKLKGSSMIFKRLPVRDRREGGIITNPAVMTMTSGPNETHPITRGAWMAGVIFNNPPAPPPDDVPPLPLEAPNNEKSMTLRERLSAHRDRADCVGCHEKIDPLGFALENFNAVGLWRDQYENGRDIDMQGNLFRKHNFADIYEFKDAIVNEKDRFARGLAEHLLSFGLARTLDANDTPSIDKITAETIAKGYRLRDLIKEVVLCESFGMKSNFKTLAPTVTSPSSK